MKRGQFFTYSLSRGINFSYLVNSSSCVTNMPYGEGRGCSGTAERIIILDTEYLFDKNYIYTALKHSQIAT